LSGGAEIEEDGAVGAQINTAGFVEMQELVQALRATRSEMYEHAAKRRSDIWSWRI
jgi:hypothetical protein